MWSQTNNSCNESSKEVMAIEQLNLSHFDRVTIIGQGIAGTCLAWCLERNQIPWRMIDLEIGLGSSRVAGGLITPITGKGLNPSWELGTYLPLAKAFYQEVGKELNEPLFHELPVVRLFKNPKEVAKWRKKCARDDISRWVLGDAVLDRSKIHAVDGGFEMKGGGWLDTRRFLAESRRVFMEEGKLELRSSVEAADHWSRDELKIWCVGAAGLLNPAARQRPVSHRCAKGEIVTIEMPDLAEQRILNRNGWLIPLGGGFYRAGATYEWSQLDDLPSGHGLETIKAKIKSFTDCEFSVVEHVAGVRPIIRNSRPLLWQDDAGLHFNGLGSKGSLYAPGVAKQLCEHLLGKEVIPQDLL